MTTQISGTAGITFPDSSTQNTSAAGFGFKNRIINGAMQISQRGTSFSTPASGTYTLDRWRVDWTGASPASVAQVAGPTGFRNALQITGAASNTLTSIQQRIESYNCSDLSGATISIQANISVSSAQTVLWALQYANAQDTWTAATTISSGTWSATSTATTFTTTLTNLPSGATNGLVLIFYPQNGGAFTSGSITITGVQLEESPTATSFDFRPQGTELALCQRYFTAFIGSVAFTQYAIGEAYTASKVRFPMQMPVTMRSSPTLTVNGSGLVWALDRIGSPLSAFSLDYASTQVQSISATVGTATIGQAGSINAGNFTNTSITFSSEL